MNQSDNIYAKQAEAKQKLIELYESNFKAKLEEQHSKNRPESPDKPVRKNKELTSKEFTRSVYNNEALDLYQENRKKRLGESSGRSSKRAEIKESLTEEELEKFKDFPFFNGNREPTEEDRRQIREDLERRYEAEENSIFLYDPVEKESISLARCKRKYGREMADKMLKAKKENNGRLDKEDFKELTRLRNPNPGPAKESGRSEVSAKSPSKTEPFIKIEHRIMRSGKARKILKKSMTLYLYLRSYIVREKFKGDALNLFERYYEQGRLAASMSIRKLARDLDLDQKTVARFLRELSDNRAIEIERIPAGEAFDSQEHNVYIFGRRDRDKNEIYYIDEIADNDS